MSSHRGTTWGLSLALLLVLCSGAGIALAEGPPPDAAEETDAVEETDTDEKKMGGMGEPSVFHTPVNHWPAGEALSLSASISEDWYAERVTATLLVDALENTPTYKAFEAACVGHPNGRFDALNKRCEVDFARTQMTSSFVAAIPPEMVQPPTVSYWIHSTGKDGDVSASFASEAQPWVILIEGDSEMSKRTRKMSRHHGHLSRFELRGDVTFFGSALVPDPNDPGLRVETDAFSEIYGLGVFSYTFRTLSALYDFSFGIGVMRGQRPKIDGESTVEGESEPGFNWGYGEVNFELHRNFSVATKLIFGASERGFAAGGGALMRIGPQFATHFETGFDWTADVGTNAWMAFLFDTVPRVPMSLTVEYTTWPQAEGEAGMRFIYNATWAITNQVEAGLSFGYATRFEALDSGFVAGVNTAYEF